MAGIDNRVLVQLKAEDDGFVAGMRNAGKSVSELQKQLGNMAQTKGANAVKEAAEYTRGLSSAIRGATPEVQKFMAALSDARKVNGTKSAYQSLAQTHELLASRYAKTRKALEQEIKGYKATVVALDKTRESMSALYQVQIQLIKKRAELNKEMDALPDRTASGAPDKQSAAYKKSKS